MAKAKVYPWLNKEVIKTIEVEGVQVVYKTLSFGAQRRIQKQCLSVNEKGKPDVDVSLVGVLQTIEAIVDWGFTDEDGEKLPITLHTFDEVLDPEFGGKIIAAVSEQVTTKVDVDRKKK